MRRTYHPIYDGNWSDSDYLVVNAADELRRKGILYGQEITREGALLALAFHRAHGETEMLRTIYARVAETDEQLAEMVVAVASLPRPGGRNG